MKLYVFGCSYSDFLPLNQTTWGHELARNLNCELVHEGRGAGSNWRMWRRCMHYLLQGEISQQDLVIIQYTGVERREFWSSHCAESSTDQQRLDTTGIINRERAYDGNLIRFKAYSWNAS
jgi:hypothetical protein